jgi:hypothetical protein
MLVSGVDALVIQGAPERIATKLMLFHMSKPAPTDGQLAKLVRHVKVADKYKVPLVNLYHRGDVPVIAIRIPLINDKDEASKLNFQRVLTLLHYGTGVKVENMSFYMDKTLGEGMHMDAISIKLLDELTASASLPSGIYPGEVFQIGEARMNLPVALSLIHFLNRKINYLRRKTPQGKEVVYPVSSNELRKAFNARTGLVDKSSSYSSMLIKSTLAVITSTKNRCFPGGWITSSRAMNKVKSDTGLVNVLGYTECVPYHHKLQMVLDHRTVVLPSSHRAIKQVDSKVQDASFLEFRAGMHLTVPRLSTSSSEQLDVQSKKEPLRVKNERTLNSFSNTKYYKTINSLNRAHALLVTCNKGNSKTKPIHYEIARNEFLHSVAKTPIIDGQGLEYTGLSALPKPLYDYGKKKFRFASGGKGKRTIEETEESPMDIDPSKNRKVSGGDKSKTPLKRSKSVRGRGHGRRQGASSSQGEEGSTGHIDLSKLPAADRW